MPKRSLADDSSLGALQPTKKRKKKLTYDDLRKRFDRFAAKVIPGRAEEAAQLFDFVDGCVRTGKSGAVYLYGLKQVGKSSISKAICSFVQKNLFHITRKESAKHIVVSVLCLSVLSSLVV